MSNVTTAAITAAFSKHQQDRSYRLRQLIVS